MFQIKEYTSVTAMPDNVLNFWYQQPINIEQKPAWIQATEKMVENIRPHYFTIMDNSKIKGIIISNIVKHLDCIKFLPEEIQEKELLKRRTDPNYFFYDVLFVTIPMSNFNGLINFKHTSIEDLLSYFVEYGKKGEINADAMFFCSLPENFQVNSDVSFEYFPNTNLNLDFNNFNDYLNSLKVKKRWDFKNKHKIFINAGGTTKITENKDIQSYDNLFKLYRNTENKNLDRNPEYLRYNDNNPFNEFHNLGNNYLWLQAQADDKTLLGFALLVKDGKQLLFKSVGINYSHSKDFSTYFNLYYAAIDYAIKNGYSNMVCGTTTYDVKRHLGCQLINRKADLVFLRDSISQTLKEMTFK